MDKLIFLPAAIFLFVMPREALAYIDPGMGSMFFQLLIGVVFAGLFTIKLWWKKLRRLIYKLTKKRSQNDEH